jgi:hypothetical protein
LRGGVRRVGGGVVLWRNLDDIASDIVESIEAAQQNRPLARQKAGNLGRAGAGAPEAKAGSKLSTSKLTYTRREDSKTTV